MPEQRWMIAAKQSDNEMLKFQNIDDDCSISVKCRCCSATPLVKVLDLGELPPSDHLLNKEDLGKHLDRYPLLVGFCPACSLIQITETIDPNVLFSENYLYFSSFSPALLQHSKENANSLMEGRNLGETSLVIELASNDGYLLRNFVEAGVPVLGIEPAPKQAAAAESHGVPTLKEFFSKELANRLCDAGKRADVIIANNVLAHVANTHDFVEGIYHLLKENGIASVEVPYVRDLIDKREFDTIYHEHLCYFSLKALVQLFEMHGLYVNDVRKIEIHGGSLRVIVGKKSHPSHSVAKLLRSEDDDGISNTEYYKSFAKNIELLRESISTTIRDLKSRGNRIAAYGAAAKGSILLNTVGLTSEDIDFVVDRNSHKHGKFMAGSSIEIQPVSELLEKMPEFTLLLAWNFRAEIMEQQAEYLRRGGRFIVPVPTVELMPRLD